MDVEQFASSLQMMAMTNDVSTMEIKWKYSFGLALRRFPDSKVSLVGFPQRTSISCLLGDLTSKAPSNNGLHTRRSVSN